MATYVFAWNPKLWGWPELPRDIARLRKRGHVDVEWSSGRARTIEPGSRAFFVRLGVEPKGVFGAGYTLTAPRTDVHWLEEKAARGSKTNYLMLRIEFLSETPLITFDELKRPPFSRFRWGVRQSGTHMPSSVADALEPWWEERVKAMAIDPSRGRKAVAAAMAGERSRSRKPVALESAIDPSRSRKPVTAATAIDPSRGRKAVAARKTTKAKRTGR